MLGLAALLVLSCKDGAAPAAGSGGAGPAVSASADPVPAGARATIVVLGSSTAAGVGPKQAGNAWVARYSSHLSQRYPSFQITNLAVPGFTTYHVQASDFVPPPGRPRPAAGNNITFALALQPAAILVSLPSNDAAASIPAAEQMANYDRLAVQSAAARVSFWVTTPQPRYFGDEAQTALQTQVRDGIVSKFTPYALDFWTPLSTSAARIRPEYDAGDGVHLNDAAHALLADAVVQAKLPEWLQSTAR